MDIYFVANRTDQSIKGECRFRTDQGHPQLWDPLTGETSLLLQFKQLNGVTSVPLEFEAFQSYFVVFPGKSSDPRSTDAAGKNFARHSDLMELEGPWTVSFDPAWGGPEKVTFENLEDWTDRPEEGIRYYSGIASYHKTFEFDPAPDADLAARIFLDVGTVHDLARIILNGMDLGVIWTAPWRMDVTKALVNGENHLEIRVANRWPNRLIGDEFMPYDGISDGQLPTWLTGEEKRTSGRYTFTTLQCYTIKSPLLPSGLLGPVVLKTDL